MNKPNFATVEVPSFRIALSEGWETNPEAVCEAACEAARYAERYVLQALEMQTTNGAGGRG